jgi:hypothetical protein
MQLRRFASFPVRSRDPDGTTIKDGNPISGNLNKKDNTQQADRSLRAPHLVSPGPEVP